MYYKVGTQKSFSNTGRVLLVSLVGSHMNSPSVSIPFISIQYVLHLHFIAFVFMCVVYHNKNELQHPYLTVS